MKCKICNQEVKSKNRIGITRHVNSSHSMSLIDYMIKFESYEVPKCACGKECKHKDGLYFSKTCGNKECTRKIQRESHLKWMKENPEKTAWRKSNMSYPEKVFLSYLEESGISDNFLIEREKSVFPYFIDFAFVDLKIAIEIDGSQHLEEKRKKSDEKKDKLLLSKGWRVLRITAKQVLENKRETIDQVNSFIGNPKKDYHRTGIYLSDNSYKKKKREDNGLTKKEIENHINQRKVERPPLNVLLKEIEETNYRSVGRKYGVSDNTIRKWIKKYKERGF